MDPITAMLLGALILTGCAKVGLAATSDAVTAARASKAGQWDWLSQDRERRAASRQAWAKAWADRRRRRHEAAGGDGEFRPGAREYAGDLYHGWWEDRLERRSKKRAARPEYVYDPDRPSLAQRFDAAVLAKVQRAREVWGQRRPESVEDAPADDLFDQESLPALDPVVHDPGTWTVGAGGERVELAPGERPLRVYDEVARLKRDATDAWQHDNWPGVIAALNEMRDRYPDQYKRAHMHLYDPDNPHDRPISDYHEMARERAALMDLCPDAVPVTDVPLPRRLTAAEMRAEWQELTAVAEEALDRGDWAAAVDALDEMEARYPSVYRTSGLRSTDTNAGTSWTGSLEHVRAKAALELQRQTNGQAAATINDTTNGGTPMTAPTGEAVNFETAVPALAALTAATQNLSEHIAGAKQSATQFNDQVNEIDVARNDVALAVQSVMEQLTERHLDTSTMASVTAAMELIKAGDLSGAMDHVDAAVAKLASAETAALEASGATAEASQTVVSKFGDAAVTVASELDGDARFVDSSGGRGSTVTSPAALNVMSTYAAQRKDGLAANPSGSDGPIAAHAGYGQATNDSLPEAYSRDS